MPDSSVLFSVSEKESVFTYDEVSRAMQFLIDAEHEALRLYGYITRSADEKLSVEILRDAADGETFYAESLKGPYSI